MIAILRRCVVCKFWLLPWRSRSQHDIAAKSCPAHKLVIWSRILKLFHINDHHIETMCRAQHLGHYLEGQGHSMTLLQKCVLHITSLFEVGFLKYFIEMITILRQRVVRNIWGCYIKGQGHSMTLQQNHIQSISSLFEVGVYNHFWQITSLCPIPIRVPLPGSTGSCFIF